VNDLPPWAQVTPQRREHIERVAALVAKWADQMRTPTAERRRWIRAAYLHDALKDAPDEDLAPYAPIGWRHPQLFHGPAAAARAAEEGETDQGVLDAAKYHSVGHADWDAAGRMLFLADYLEPGRSGDRERKAAMAARVPRETERVLAEVAAERLHGFVDAGWVLLPETVEFWNALAQGA
jgi:HD superfamily phosphohydrolase YqeK